VEEGSTLGEFNPAASVAVPPEAVAVAPPVKSSAEPDAVMVATTPSAAEGATVDPASKSNRSKQGKSSKKKR
jgi:hypothetical protein